MSNMNRGRQFNGWAVACALALAAMLLAGCGSQQQYTEAQFSDMPGVTVTPSGTTTNLGPAAAMTFTPTATPVATPAQTPPPTQTAPSPTAPAPSSPASTAPADPSRTPLPVLAGRSDMLSKGDMLMIRFSDLISNPLPPIEQRIKENGTIMLMENQTFVAAGKTRGDLEQEIRARYVPNYYRQLTVNIELPERYYFVAGEVRSPNKLIYTPPMTVLKAIAAAGGFTDFANKKNVKVTRADGHIETENCVMALKNPTLDLFVYPGDTVHVSRSWL
jgi:polysaccharide export outer membrane protein